MYLAQPPVAAHKPAHLTHVADEKADAAPAAPQVIGKVTASQGEAFILRSGERIPAKAEAPVFQSDAVETKAGAQISLVFADRETFVLKDNTSAGRGPRSRRRQPATEEPTPEEAEVEAAATSASEAKAPARRRMGLEST